MANGSEDEPPREELDAAMESFRRAWTGVIGELAERIESGSELPDAASLEGLYESSLPTLAAVDSALEELRGRLATVVGGRNGRELQLRIAAVGSHAAGWIEGGGVALAVVRDLPDPITAEAVGRLLAGRMAFVAQRAEQEIEVWLAGMNGADRATPTSAADEDVSLRRDRYARLLARATALGVRVRNAPETPSDGYLRKLVLQLDEVERKREDQQRDAPLRARRLQDLLFLAERLKVRPKVVPTDPSDAWLDRMEQRLREVAEDKGVSFEGAAPAPLGRGHPTPDQVTRIEAAEGLETSEAPHPAQLAVGPQARLALLVERAESAGFDLGRVPASPSTGWLDDTEGRLDTAIAHRRQEMHAERTRREAERKVRLDRIVHNAAAVGVALGPVPTFPTDDWLDRMEQRLSTSLLATPPSASVGEVDNLREDSGILPDRVRAFLVFEEGTVQERIWPVDEGAVTLGRGKDNVVQIRDDAGVSRRHATLQQMNGSYVIRDEGSTKGTLVDGAPVKETKLAGGERITLGDTEFVFRLR